MKVLGISICWLTRVRGWRAQKGETMSRRLGAGAGSVSRKLTSVLRVRGTGKKFALVMAATAVTSIVLAAPSWADPPVPYSFTTERVYTFDCGDGVVLTEPYAYTEKGLDFFKDGELVRSLGHASFDGTITNEATGEQFRDRNHFSIEIDYVANTYTFRGPIFQLHSVDGGPVLILDAGTITGDLDTGEVIRGSAKHPALFPNIFADYTDVLCEGVGA